MTEDVGERIGDAWLAGYAELLTPGDCALDLGCGTGEDSRDLLDRGLSVVGFDGNAERITHARQIAPAATFVLGDLRERLPFDDAEFDLVVASLSIHYFDWRTTEAIVAEIARVLQPGGKLICRVNRVGDTNFLYGEGNEIEPNFFEVERGKTKRFFDEPTLRAALEPDFHITSIQPATTHRWGKLKRILVACARREA